MPETPTLHVLAVDDEDAILRLVRSALTRLGYRVSTAESAEVALDVAKQSGPFDLLITDLMMPGMQGDELAQTLRAQHQPDLKVLYLTGYPRKLFEHRPALSPWESVLQKPVTLAQLREGVSRAIASTPDPA